jgi:hypothetical protein
MDAGTMTIWLIGLAAITGWVATWRSQPERINEVGVLAVVFTWIAVAIALIFVYWP